MELLEQSLGRTTCLPIYQSNHSSTPVEAQCLYELEGDVGNVAFRCGYTSDDGDQINLYYGAADTSVALATGSIAHLLRWLDEHGRLTT